MVNFEEQELQKAVVQWLRTVLFFDRSFFFGVANETGVAGKRGMILGKIRKAMGVLAGIPDINIGHRPEGSKWGYLVGIELKTAKRRQTTAQKAVQGIYGVMGWPYRVCRSIDEVETFLLDIELPIRVKRLPLEGGVS